MSGQMSHISCPKSVIMKQVVVGTCNGMSGLSDHNILYVIVAFAIVRGNRANVVV